MKKIIFLILVVSISLSCSKEEEKLPRVLQNGTISSSLHPFLFKKGSYWIFENQNTGQIDSTSVISLAQNTYTVPPSGPGQGPRGKEEYYDITYLSTVNGNYNEQLIGSLISKGFINGGYLYLSDGEIGSESLNAKLTTIHDTLTIEGNLYKDVVKMENSQDFYLTSDVNLYYADSIGVVKKEIILNDSITDVWNLIRFSVNL